MESMLKDFENNEQMLLMFLSGELPESDMAAVRRRLEGDAALRAELDQLIEAKEASDKAFASADLAEPARSDAVTRRTMAAMRQWRTEAAGRVRAGELQEDHSSSWAVPRWTYLAGAAAAVVLGFSVYLANTTPKGMFAPGLGVAHAPESTGTQRGEAAALEELRAWAEADDLSDEPEETHSLMADANTSAELNRIEQQLRWLAEESRWGEAGAAR